MVIEFRQAPLSQKAPFAAEIEFFAVEKCQNMITTLFAQYVRYQQRLQESEDALDENDDATTARECFQVLFADHPEFADDVTAEAFLSSATAVNDPKVLNKLLKWTLDILNLFMAERGVTLTLESDTAEGLVEQFMPFTRKVAYGSYKGKPLAFSPWPLVQLVR